jgi:hypothetical protein
VSHVDLTFGQFNFILDVQMARPLIIEFVGTLYHVTARGNAREDIYRDDVDRQQSLMRLQNTVNRYISIAMLIA